jgi:tetratricopeptide (TPR) repeat protein
MPQDSKNKIYLEEILPLTSGRASVDWAALDTQFEGKYGAVGRELVLKAKVHFYAEAKDWKNMYATLSEFIGRYRTDALKPSSLNYYSWRIFENFADRGVLKKAANWSLEAVQRGENEPMYVDTHANVLYRLGKTKDAIEWEEKAFSLATNEPAKKEFQITIDKMKKGEPTWPTPPSATPKYR